MNNIAECNVNCPLGAGKTITAKINKEDLLRFFHVKLSTKKKGFNAFVRISFWHSQNYITFCLSVSLSSLQALSCFFQLSTLAEDSCSASTSRALFSLNVCSSVSHFLALVLLSDMRRFQEERYEKKGHIDR